ncbi:MAG: HD domain-containing protein [Phycisphaerae bacterium]|nr:HD domain-containing protein [Phycisphaerae bacterium]
MAVIPFIQTSSPVTHAGDPGAGRLPAPTHHRILPEEQFRRICEQWRSRGIWLSLWGAAGELIADDPTPGRFWELFRGSDLRRSDGALLDQLATCARRALAETAENKTSRVVVQVPFDRCPEDIRVATVPVRVRRRSVGVVLALAVSTDKSSEHFRNFCGNCRVDYQVAKRFRAEIEAAGDSIENWSGLLALCVEQARDIESAQAEITSLTNNLESTYEELHLIYEVSRLMGIPQRPTQMLERVSREMLEVSRAAGMAFVLTRTEPGEGADRRDLVGSSRPISERVVQVGEGAPDLNAVLRLDACVPLEQKQEADHILFNQGFKRPEFSWAASWLRHFVVIPLRLDNEVLGSFYAINVIDDGDYTSVDIQLLKAVADRISAALKNQHLYDDLGDLLMGLMYAIVNSVDAKDPYTFGHSERVAYFSRMIAKAAGLSPVDCERVYLAGLLHDVGKIGVPDAILTKPGKLTAQEFELLKKHPEIGERILGHIRQLNDLIPGVLFHHERMDGRGYPRRLSGKDIPLLGRIICLADSFDAMTSNRTYRAALPISVATAEIRRCSGNQFDPELAELFLKLGPQRLYEEAKQSAKGDPNIARIGALSSILSGRPQAPGSEHSIR